MNCKFCFLYSQVLNHLHKKLRNMSKKSEASKKKVRPLNLFNEKSKCKYHADWKFDILCWIDIFEKR